jgi:hypothetical protein
MHFHLPADLQEKELRFLKIACYLNLMYIALILCVFIFRNDMAI